MLADAGAGSEDADREGGGEGVVGWGCGGGESVVAGGRYGVHCFGRIELRGEV